MIDEDKTKRRELNYYNAFECALSPNIPNSNLQTLTNPIPRDHKESEFLALGTAQN